MKKVLMIVNEDRFFLSHRKDIAITARKEGWDVTVVTKNTGRRAEIEEMGFKYIELPINPTGMNPFQELRTFRFLYHLYNSNRDAIIHHVGLKNILWGGLAARLAHTSGVVDAVSGMGILFGDERSSKIISVVEKLLKIGMRKKNLAVIFQNHDDERYFVDKTIVRPEAVEFIKGSGVDLDEYTEDASQKVEPLAIIFTARMLREKGVLDLVQAARLLKRDYHDRIQFWLCGDLSENPRALKEEDVTSLTDGEYVKWLGYRRDVRDLLRKASIMAFPSYYREGVPRSLIEASASGLPIVTTTSVGCKDTVEDGVNGYLIPPHNPEALAAKLRILIENPVLRRHMGRQSRIIAERDYDVDIVVARHLKIYERLLRNSSKS